MTTGSIPTPMRRDTRERRSLLASALVHTGLIAGLVLYEPPPAAEPLTVITFVDLPEATAPAPPPEDVIRPLVAAPEPAPEPEETAVAEPAPTRNVSEDPPEEPRHFARERADAPVAPRPQSTSRLHDDVRNRLLAASTPTDGAPAPAAATARAIAPDRPAPGVTAGSPSAGRVSLSRGDPIGRGRSVNLDRRASGPPSSSARARLERVAAPAPPGRGELAASEDSTLTRTLAGASLTGPIAGRPILEHPSPVYPEWAKRSAMEGSVKLYFVVQPDGMARSNVLVERTSGLPDFDENAVSALRAWRFEPLPPGVTGDQWGTVTFDYRLTN